MDFWDVEGIEVASKHSEGSMATGRHLWRKLPFGTPSASGNRFMEGL